MLFRLVILRERVGGPSLQPKIGDTQIRGVDSILTVVVIKPVVNCDFQTWCCPGGRFDEQYFEA